MASPGAFMPCNHGEQGAITVIIWQRARQLSNRNPLRMKFWVNLLRKQSGSTEVLTSGEENLGLVVQEGEDEYQLVL